MKTYIHFYLKYNTEEINEILDNAKKEHEKVEFAVVEIDGVRKEFTFEEFKNKLFN